ncbi:galactokinase [Paenibacillus darwinianus]|uniref:Galactokinase n=1 Tax=Paenibacillus darwinianus TaxID=1380763 RepID=A0A9W5W6W4_9BACL|nr:galactokinase [Paenibacillus darwinianus]EXX85284.1 galactokinase [Paenibacillus darwinianus]EXX86817.1 galactokinase [Paenibacillus darwinianus]EXX86826.1 galactokinase [Paenibacillus darwinianus]
MADLQTLKRRFVEIYGGGEEGVRSFHAPGRVNLIGEHTDYNGGYVFPAALTFGTTLLIRGREDDWLGLASTNFPEHKHLPISPIVYDEADDWMNYPKGIVRELQNNGASLPHGFDLLFHGEIPNGAGLSSSASIEVVTAYALLTMAGLPIDTVEIARLSQKSENEFNGVKCGIMDQFAVANGKKDHAILLMCDTLEYEHVPFKSGEYKLIIGNTNKRRGLVDSKYNERRAQCEQAVKDLQQTFPNMTLLGQIGLAEFTENKQLIKDETVRKRARHVVEEIDRVLRSIEVLKADDLASFGQLMNGSHDSLRDLYEVTGAELDAMVDAARQVSGVLGSRMTGAGFGGCTVSLVHKDSVERFKNEVGRKYTEATGLVPDFYVCSIGNGVEEIG